MPAQLFYEADPLALDPGYAMAHAGLASAERALALDDGLAAARAALGRVNVEHESTEAFATFACS